MATWLKVNTAVEVKLGPFVSSSDGFTPMTSLSIAQADVRLAKVEGDWTQKNETTAAVHEENGWYRVLLDATDTDTQGPLIVAVAETGALPVWREFMVMVETNIADAVWNAPVAEHQTPANESTGWYLKYVTDNVDSIVYGGLPLSVGSFSSGAEYQLKAAVWDEPASIHTVTGSFGALAGSLTFTVAGQVDANVKSVADTTVTGSGTGGDPWGP